MKRNVCFLLVILMAFVSICACTSSKNEPAQKNSASTETRKLAEECIGVLIEEKMSFDHTLGRRIDEVYRSLKQGRPEFQELEELPDSSEALLELYEEYAEALTLEAYTAAINVSKAGSDAESFNWPTEDPESYALYMRPMVIEGLLSREEYFGRFGEAERTRFINAFTCVHNTITAANTEVFGQDYEPPRFISCEGERFLEGAKLVCENGEWKLQS